ncbi:hypothetical protein KBC40_02765 [Patescibacteria group bacterium]|nr:hypothetical protein [Patescibacteria group bacterium]
MSEDRSVRSFLRALPSVKLRSARSSFLEKLAQGFFANCLESGLSCDEILGLSRLFLDPEIIENGTELCERKSLLEHLLSLQQISSVLERGVFLNKLAKALLAESVSQGMTANERLEFVSYVLGFYISYIKETKASAPPSRNS